jgi:hypothetical protein
MLAALGPRLGNRVESAIAEGLAARETTRGEPATAECAVALDGLHRILRTAGVEAAVLAEERADESLVAAQE